MEEPESIETRWHTLNDPKTCSTELSFEATIGAIRKSIHLHGSKDESSIVHSSNRVERSPEIPDFIQDSYLWQDVESADDKPDQPTLYDKFLDVRRHIPEQTAVVFREEMLFASQFIGEFSHSEESLNEFRRKWKSLSWTEQERILPEILIGSLAESASQTLFALTAIKSVRRNFRIRMGCLRDISLMYRADLLKDPDLQKIYEAQIDTLRFPKSWPRDKLSTVLLQNLLYWSSPDQCEVIIEEFSHRYPDADKVSVVAFIDHYLRIKEPEQAFNYFKRLPDELLRDPNTIVKNLRDRLLRVDVVTKSEDGANFKYLPQILALNMPSDEALHNIVIENAIKNGLPDVAWDVYQYLEKSQFKVNARSHLVLLRDAFTRGTLPRVNAIMTAIHERKDLTNDPYLVSYSMNIVRVICCHERQIGANEALAHIMALYDRAYDRTPLANLQITYEKANDEGLPQPTPISLAFTIWTYILVQSNEKEVVRLWQWIKHLILTGDEAITAAARYDVIYNGLLLFYARKGSNLSRALEVLEYMLCKNLCLPTLRTWSILLCSFLRRGRVEEARRVLAMMRREGFTVQDITGKYSDYVPAGVDLESLAEMTLETLDETRLPETVEQLLSNPEQLHQS